MLRLICAALCLFSIISAPRAADQPNILWLTTEDIGPHLGCYGDEVANTPNLDAFAKKSVMYLNAWSTAPVCAPARTTLISGMYPPSTGAEHMRSETSLPKDFLMYPNYMRQAGYYCVNPGKEDYNLTKTGKVWDNVNKKDPWPELKEKQPFMAVLNHTGTHESKIRTRPHKQVIDPASIKVPAYHPDTPEVRQDWAQYYDNITVMDGWFAQQMKKLEEAGLADDTIVFFYGDHGSGMPRSKRWPYNSGLLVPFIVYVPPKYQHLAEGYEPGKKSDQLIGFIDCAQTVISLAGQKPPEHMQGHAFMGKYADPEQPYAFGFRGRMDERYDMVRVVRNKRYLYIRNYMPHKPYGQHVGYMFVTPTTRIWKEMFDAGELNAAQSHFWKTKPYEELYDLEEDPDEVNNLASSPKHRNVLDELRKAHEDWVFRVRDVGFLPEGEIHRRAKMSTPYEVGHNPDLYPLKEIYRVANAAASMDLSQIPFLIDMLDADDSAVRFWAALGLQMRGETGLQAAQSELREVAKTDPSNEVRVVAAETLSKYGDEEDLKLGNKTLIELANPETSDNYVSIRALNAIDQLGEKASSLKPQVEKLPKNGKWQPPRAGGYVSRLLEKIESDK